MKSNKILVFLTFLIVTNSAFSQSDSIEVYLIDAFCTREIPYTFKLSFYTSDVCKSKVILEEKYEYTVAADYVDLHKAEIIIDNLAFTDTVINFVIITETDSGVVNKSETFDFDIPYEPNIKEGSDLLTLCLFGSSIFLIPYPSFVAESQQNYFGLTKEIPIISFRTKSRNYPSGFVSLEYTYVFNMDDPSYLRGGYKKLFEVPGLEFISPGISLYTDFSTNWGFSPEFSIGLFNVLDTFTAYIRCRSNITLHPAGTNFQEIYLGFYSSLFSFYLN